MAAAGKLAASFATIDETAAYLKVDRKTVRKWISAGILTAYRIGPQLIRVDLDSVKAVRLGSDAE